MSPAGLQAVPLCLESRRKQTENQLSGWAGGVNSRLEGEARAAGEVGKPPRLLLGFKCLGWCGCDRKPCMERLSGPSQGTANRAQAGHPVVVGGYFQEGTLAGGIPGSFRGGTGFAPGRETGLRWYLDSSFLDLVHHYVAGSMSKTWDSDRSQRLPGPPTALRYVKI